MTRYLQLLTLVIGIQLSEGVLFFIRRVDHNIRVAKIY